MSVTECLPSMRKALGSVLRTIHKKRMWERLVAAEPTGEADLSSKGKCLL